MNMDLTKNEKTKLWVSRIFGVLLSAALAAFLILFYLGLIDQNMFTLGMLGFGSCIFIFSAQFLSVKSTPFWVLFSLGIAAVCMLAFLGLLGYFIAEGVFTI